MYLNSHKESECCGCTACQQICPKNCIEMKKNQDGFLYPEIVNKEVCISCKLCEKVCPFVNDDIEAKQKYNKPECYYGWHSDEEVRMLSTSGAAFIAIVQAAQVEGYSAFYGASYMEDLTVRHIGIENLEDIGRLRNSKYVQSQMDDVYKDIKARLSKGQKILFSGTPCQVEGLQKFVGERLKKNLFTVALICHGVASPDAFKKYLDDIEHQENDKILAFKFRDKRLQGDKLSHRFTTITLENGKQLCSTENEYTLAFGIGLMQRISCFSCPFTTPYRSADISIGDFWGLEKHIPEITNEISKGISLVLIHSECGKHLLENIKSYMMLEQVPLEYSINPAQQQLSKPTVYNSRRNKFLKNVLVKNKPYTKVVKKEITLWKIKKLPARIKGKIRRMIGGAK